MTKIKLSSFSFFYKQTSRALNNISMAIQSRDIVALIGPSGCGKSTLLKSINRIHEVSYKIRVTGKILFGNQDIYSPEVDTTILRQRIGMVFQKPCPFPNSIFENVAYGLRIAGGHSKKSLHDLVETSLTQSGLWEEVKDRLEDNALSLSGGQQQRLCIARALATEPEVLLMDEPCSALDPISTQKIESLIKSLQETYTIIIVTHNMQQAARVSNKTGFMVTGELIEYDDTKKIFTSPANKITENYITGRFG